MHKGLGAVAEYVVHLAYDLQQHYMQQERGTYLATQAARSMIAMCISSNSRSLSVQMFQYE